MTGNPARAAADWTAMDRRRRAAQVRDEVALERMEPEPSYRAKSARVIERELWGEPTSQWNGDASPVLALPYVVWHWERPNGRTVTVRQFRVGIDGYD